MANMGDPSRDPTSSVIYGADTIDLRTLDHPLVGLANTPQGWRAVFERSLDFMRMFLRTHDPFEILAKTSCQVLSNLALKEKYLSKGDVKSAVILAPSELAEIEVLQALALMQTVPRKRIPAAPSNMERFFNELPKLPFAFAEMHQTRHPPEDERSHLIRKVRLQTIYQRNSFLKSDCEAVVLAILSQFDDVTLRQTVSAFLRCSLRFWLWLSRSAADKPCSLIIGMRRVAPNPRRR